MIKTINDRDDRERMGAEQLLFDRSTSESETVDDQPSDIERTVKIDTSQFKPMSHQELNEVLGLTIKKDDDNKAITFLSMLSAYTEDSQLNISFNAPSSTGKSYIPTEIAQLFPEEDVIEIGYCSPRAFFYQVGNFDNQKKGYIVNFSRKILIFLDQPHTDLLQRLRPLLSHDKKEILLQITDKTQKFGLRTKNIFLKGYPSVIFCTAGLKIDEQESTRFILLSPETNQEKIREAINEKIKKETDNAAYRRWLEENPERKLLKERIRAIKEENIQDIKIENPEIISEIFSKVCKTLKPRHQRDIGRYIALIKTFALLNCWFRKRSGSTIVANVGDIFEVSNIWIEISEAQESNLPPHVYSLFWEVIVPAWEEKNENGSRDEGLTRLEVMRKHLQVYGKGLPDWLLRQQIIPMLESAGFITQEPDPKDKRKMLIHVTYRLTVSAGGNSKSPDEGKNNDLKEEKHN